MSRVEDLSFEELQASVRALKLTGILKYGDLKDRASMVNALKGLQMSQQAPPQDPFPEMIVSPRKVVNDNQPLKNPFGGSAAAKLYIQDADELQEPDSWATKVVGKPVKPPTLPGPPPTANSRSLFSTHAEARAEAYQPGPMIPYEDMVPRMSNFLECESVDGELEMQPRLSLVGDEKGKEVTQHVEEEEEEEEEEGTDDEGKQIHPKLKRGHLRRTAEAAMKGKAGMQLIRQQQGLSYECVTCDAIIKNPADNTPAARVAPECHICKGSMCTKCRCKCKACQRIVCETHSDRCETCRLRNCEICITHCAECNKQQCIYCVIECSDCERALCESCCPEKCKYCKRYFCGDCLKRCHECPRIVCGHCWVACRHLGTQCKKCTRVYCKECGSTCEGCKQMICEISGKVNVTACDHMYCQDCSENCVQCNKTKCPQCDQICACGSAICSKCGVLECGTCRKSVCHACVERCENCSAILCGDNACGMINEAQAKVLCNKCECDGMMSPTSSTKELMQSSVNSNTILIEPAVEEDGHHESSSSAVPTQA